MLTPFFMSRVSNEKVDLPDGVYNALWSGYQMKILAPDKDVYIMTENGVRGMYIETTIEIKDGVVRAI